MYKNDWKRATNKNIDIKSKTKFDYGVIFSILRLLKFNFLIKNIFEKILSHNNELFFTKGIFY